MLFRTRYNVLFRQFRLLTAQAGSIPAAIRRIFENCYKSACTRASLIPYPVIAAAVGGDPEAVSRVVRHYSGYIAALSTRTSYGPDGYPRPQVDEDLRGRLEAKLIISILDFDLS